MHVNKVITLERVITLMVFDVFKPEHDKKKILNLTQLNSTY